MNHNSVFSWGASKCGGKIKCNLIPPHEGQNHAIFSSKWYSWSRKHRHWLRFGKQGGMEGQANQNEKQDRWPREENSLPMLCFDTCNCGYSFSSNFILLLTKIVSAKKVALWTLEELHEVFLSERPYAGTACHQEQQPWGGLTTAPQIHTTPQHIPGIKNRVNNLHQINVWDSSVIAAGAWCAHICE